MTRVGLLGHPVSHSLSPAMHTAAFAAAGLSGTYDAVDVGPTELAATLRRCADEGWVGANVTVPHKQAVFELCDQVDDVARLTGAVNTLVFRDGTIRGSNTDVPGFVDSLQQVGELRPEGVDALVIGAGGAARATVVGLLRAGARRVTVANRSLSNAGKLAASLRSACPGTLRARALNPWTLCEMSPDLVVNATSVGLALEPGSDRWDAAQRFLDNIPFEAFSGALAFDLVYTPASTAFLQRAEAAGCRTVNGLDMLARQGALSFERWTGTAADAVLPAMLATLTVK